MNKVSNRLRRNMKEISMLRIILVMGILFAFQPIEACAGSKVEVGDKVPNFILEDANEYKHEFEMLRGKVIIFVMGPRSQKENSNKWAEILNQVYPQNDSLEIYSVFDMRGIPFFMSKGFVRGKVKEKNEKHPVPTLLDWKQKVNKLLGANKDETDIYVFDPDGILASHYIGEYSDEKFESLRNDIVEIRESKRLERGRQNEEDEE